MRGFQGLLFLFSLAAYPAHAQFFDDFSDGSFLEDPPWVGDIDLWTVSKFAGSPALATNGRARFDTLSLSTPASFKAGTWSFTFGHRGINLSTFNGARVFVCADGADVERHPRGYYVQMGTNNSDALSFWRVDGDWSDRTQLYRGTAAVVEGDSSDLHVIISRDADDRWTLSANGIDAPAVVDGSIRSCTHLAVWVKHSATGIKGLYFDSFLLSEQSSPPSAPPSSPGPTPSPGDLVINEIHPAPSGGGSEFVELYNRSASVVDLATLRLRDARSSPVDIISQAAELRPGGYVVLVNDPDAFADQFRTVPAVHVRSWPPLNNGGDAVVIEAGGMVIDSVAFHDDQSETGRSLERIDPFGPSFRHNFALSSDPFGATPGERNSVFSRDTTGPRLIFARELDPTSVQLFFDEPIDTTRLASADVQVGGIPAGEISIRGTMTIQAAFGGGLREQHIAVFGAADLSGNQVDAQSARIAFRPRWRDLIINEIMYQPMADDFDGFPNQHEFVELVNLSDRLLYVDGMYRTRTANEEGDADTANVAAPLEAVEPGEFVLLAGERSIPEARSLKVEGLALANGGDRIRLHAPDGEIVDDVSYLPAWHHPDLMDPRGISLERIAADVGSDLPSNWTSSVDASGATPGRLNSVSLARPALLATSPMSVTPNPFSPDHDGHEDAVRIECALREGGSHVRLRIFDLAGLVVRHLISGELVTAGCSYIWDGRDDHGRPLHAGIYVALLETFSESAETAVSKAPIVIAPTR